MKLDHKAGVLELDLKDAFVDDGDVYRLKGYASTFGNEDLGGDVVHKGAFVDSLKTRWPKLCINHNMHSELPIGRITECREDAKGLYFEAELPKDDSLVSGRIAPQIRIGAAKGVSIGYRVKDGSPRGKGRGQDLKKVDLWEISIVTQPMNEEANVSGFKSLMDKPLLPVSDKSCKSWDASSALGRVREFTGSGASPSPSFAKCFLYVEPGKEDDFDGYKFLIADVENDCLKAVPQAVFRATATAMGHRDGAELTDAVKDAVIDAAEPYYAAMQLASPRESVSRFEYDNLTPDAREVRLKASKPSSGLAKYLASDARDVRPNHRDGGLDVKTALDEIQAQLGELRSLFAESKGAVGPHS